MYKLVVLRQSSVRSAREKAPHEHENSLALGRTLRGNCNLDEPLPHRSAEILNRLNEKERVAPDALQAKSD
jgi:hypothetical protein